MTRTTTATSRTPSAPVVFVLLSVFPLAVLAFGGVHEPARILLSVLMAGAGASMALRSRYADNGRIAKILVTAVTISALPLLPVPGSIRSALHGELSQPVLEIMSLTGGAVRPLALDPSGALLGLCEATAVLLFGLGVAGWATRAGRVKSMLWALLTTGVVVVILLLAHQGLGLSSIYGTGIGSVSRDGFFGPFVNPNHGGILCAALLPIGLACSVDGSVRARALGILGVGCLAFGVWASGSRGAVLAALMGLAATFAALGGRRTRAGILMTLVMTLVGVGVVGPERALQALTQLVAPSVNDMVAAGYVDLTTGRLDLFADALQIFAQAPLIGVGAGGFDIAHAMVRSGPSFSSTTHAHSEPLQLLAEHGMVVAALVFAGVTLIAFRGLEALSTWAVRPDRQWQIASFMGCLTALLVAAVLDFPLRLHSHSVLAVIALGGLIGIARPQRGGRSLSPAVKYSLKGTVALVFVGLGLSASGGAGLWSDPTQSRGDGKAWWDAVVDGAPRTDGLSSARAHFARAAVRSLNRQDLQWLARTEYALGNADAAAQVLDMGISLYPTMPWLWRDRARLAQRSGDAEDARQAWGEMLALDLPPGTDPLDVIQEAVFGGDFETPIIQARSILPERADRYRQAARVMDQLGLVEESDTLFRHALSLEPDGVFHFAEALSRWGRPADAVMLLEMNRPNCPGKTLYAQGMLKLDRPEVAAEAFVEALRSCGAKSWVLRVGLAKSRLLSGDSRGEDVVGRLLEERPDAHGLRRVWLWVLSRKGRPSEAVRHLEHLKYAGVLSAVENTALERSRLGLPFSMPRPQFASAMP